MQRQEQRQPILVTGGEIDIFVDDDFIGSVVSVGIDETIVDIGYVVTKGSQRVTKGHCTWSWDAYMLSQPCTLKSTELQANRDGFPRKGGTCSFDGAAANTLML